MSPKKPIPLNPSPSRKHCPVCGEVAYSHAGVHPQCAVHQADTRRMKRTKRPEKARKTAASKLDVKAWHKLCPACAAQVHIRRTTCDCAHAFRGAPSGGEWD